MNCVRENKRNTTFLVIFSFVMLLWVCFVSWHSKKNYEKIVMGIKMSDFLMRLFPWKFESEFSNFSLLIEDLTLGFHFKYVFVAKKITWKWNEMKSVLYLMQMTHLCWWIYVSIQYKHRALRWVQCKYFSNVCLLEFSQLSRRQSTSMSTLETTATKG